MSNQNARHDDNFRKVLLGQTDDAAAETRPLLVDPTTGELKVTATLDAAALDTDTTNFNRILSAADDDVQKALDTIDNNAALDSELTTLENKVETVPTELKISTASKGGLLRCIDSATGDTARTTDGWIEDEKYGWYSSTEATAVSAEFDSAVTRTGRLTLKLSATNATGKIYASNVKGSSTLAEKSKYLQRIKPNTKYRFSCYVKTLKVAADSVFIAGYQYDSAGTVGTASVSTKLTGTNDWTLLTTTFTSDSDAYFFRHNLVLNVVGNISDAWFDVNSMTLEEVVTDTSFTGKVAEKIRPILQAVTTTDSIDQSLDSGGAYANTYALTTGVDEGATHIQTFTPTKKYITQIGVWVVAKGSGNWTLTLHNAANELIGNRTITNANLVEGTFNYFFDRHIWASGDLHFHLTSTVADGTCKANTSDDLETASYIQKYAKKTEGFTVISNGIKTELKSDKDGLLNNSIINLDNGKYRYDVIWSRDSFVSALDLFDAKMVNRLGYIGQDGVANGLSLFNAADYYILKVNTTLPIKHLKFKLTTSGITGSEKLKFYLSKDNVTYVEVAATVGANISPVIETDVFNGLNVFYIKAAGHVSGIVYWKECSIEADLDISSIPTGLVYPLTTNQFSESWNTPSNTSSYVYRQAKYTNEYGVVTPAIELNDGATGIGTAIGYLPLKLDNSQETTPSIKILASSGIASDTVLDADGEYVALSSAADEGVINYQVGTGATCTAITKNTIYLSSNSNNADSTQDPSLQGNFIVGVRNQGITDRIKDIGDEIEYVRNKAVKSSEWTPWTPTLTWTTGTPETNVVTKARYKILDGVCYFSFYYTADDGNGATALTISLPVLPKDNDSLTALESQQKVNTTWTSPLAYIDNGATTIAFRNLSTATDGQAVIVMVSGSYEI